MPDPSPADLQHLEDFKHWKPEVQERALELLKQRQRSPWKPFYCPISDCDGHPHGDWAFEHARSDQRPPAWAESWLVWANIGGRGSGKTRTGSEVTHRVTALVPRIHLVAATGPDFRDTMVEGVSGILATSPPDKRPEWEPSKKKLTWPNGCIAQGYSAEEPDRLRGPQCGFAWADEPAHYDLIDDVWDNLMFGLRLKSHNGASAKVAITSTPKPTKWMKALLKRDDTITHRVSTYANLENLDPAFKRMILDKYEGTRIGRQELHGEVLEDVEGALWDWEMFRYVDDVVNDLVRVVVAVDPAGTANKRSDETGIIVLGIDAGGTVYVLADYSGKYSPNGWAQRADGAAEHWGADAIVAEKNYGGDMVKTTLTNAGVFAKVILVDSRRGKAIRAEPIVALYEQQRVVHVGKRGDLGTLEDEQTSWVPGEGDSPNRVDALVHGVTNLAKPTSVASVSSPSILERYTSPVSPFL